jgi:hypothetical protein
LPPRSIGLQLESGGALAATPSTQEVTAMIAIAITTKMPPKTNSSLVPMPPRRR